MGLLSGLEKFGLKSLEKVQVYDDVKKEQDQREKAGNKEVKEEELLFEKKYTCPVCGKDVKSKTIKIGKAKLLGVDVDMRPKYQTIDPLKYDVVACEFCGYAGLTRYFNALSDMQIKLIKEEISSVFNYNQQDEKDMFTYDEALERHKLALLSSVVKKSRASEKAYICLKTAWLLRGKAESISKDEADYEEQIKECKKEEIECLQEAYKGFIKAMSTESSSSICGMDQITLDYLCAALAYETGDYMGSQRMIGKVFAAGNQNRRMRDKAAELKDILAEELKKKDV